MLSRSINQLDATALVVGIIIGASIFVQPSVITGAVPTVGGVFAVWLASGVLTLFGALIAAELASAYPHAGGVYVFLKESFSPAVGFLWGWAMFWTMHTGIIAVIATVFARYVTFFFPAGDVGARAIAVAAVVALTAINYIGVKQGSVVQTTFTLLKVAAIVLIIAVAFALGPRVPVAPGRAAAASLTFSQLSAGDRRRTVRVRRLAHGHLRRRGDSRARAHDPSRARRRCAPRDGMLHRPQRRVLPRAEPDRIAGSSRVAADAADSVLGRGGAALMSAIVAVSTSAH